MHFSITFITPLLAASTIAIPILPNSIRAAVATITDAGSAIEARQPPPWFYMFRECKKNDPRPQCPKWKREEVNVEEVSVPTTVDDGVEVEADLEARQLPPWYHMFRECKKNDPRPQCPKWKRDEIEAA